MDVPRLHVYSCPSMRQTPAVPMELMRCLEATAQAWNAEPTPLERVANVGLFASGHNDTTMHLAVAQPVSTTHSTPPPVHGTMANFRSSDPLGGGVEIGVLADLPSEHPAAVLKGRMALVNDRS
jgi:hypothetical protein